MYSALFLFFCLFCFGSCSITIIIVIIITNIIVIIIIILTKWCY